MTVSKQWTQLQMIFLACFGILLTSPWKYMLWIVIRTVSVKPFYWVPKNPKHIFLWRNQENVYLDIPIIWSYAEWLLKLDNMVRVNSKFDNGMSWLKYELTKVRVDQKRVRVD